MALAKIVFHVVLPMWECSTCGRMHEKIHDANWNCVCKNEPNAVWLPHAVTIREYWSSREYWSFREIWTFAGRALLRVLLGSILGMAIGAIGGYLLEFPIGEGMSLGATVGIGVGILWAILQEAITVLGLALIFYCVMCWVSSLTSRAIH